MKSESEQRRFSMIAGNGGAEKGTLQGRHSRLHIPYSKSMLLLWINAVICHVNIE